MDVPVELLDEIASHLELPDLYHLSLVSRLWRKVAEPWLYRTLYCCVSHKDTTAITFRGHPVSNLVQQMIDRPELAVHVKIIEFSFAQDSTVLSDNQESHNTIDYITFVNAAKKVNLVSEDASVGGDCQDDDKTLIPTNPKDRTTFTKWWLRMLLSGEQEPQIVLLLSLLSQVENIICFIPPQKSLSWKCSWNLVSWDMLCFVPHRFKKLRKVLFRKTDLALSNFVPLLSSPSMEEVEIIYNKEGYIYLDDGIWSFPQLKSSATSLVLVIYGTKFKAIADWLRQFRGLKTLSLHIWSPPMMDLGSTMFASLSQPIIEEISSQKDTLRHLQLRGRSYLKYPTNLLHGLDKLVVLAGGLDVLSSPDGTLFHLPPNLKAVHLQFTQEDYHNLPGLDGEDASVFFRQLANVREGLGSCPQLKVLCFESEEKGQLDMIIVYELAQKFFDLEHVSLRFPDFDDQDPSSTFKQLVKEFPE